MRLNTSHYRPWRISAHPFFHARYHRKIAATEAKDILYPVV